MDKWDIGKLKNIQSGLIYLKSRVDKLGIEKLETTPVHLSKLSDAVKYEVVKKIEYNKLVKKLIILIELILVFR